MSGHGQKFSRRQETVISTLLTCPSLTEAAHQAGIGEATLRRWLKDDAFAEAYREARRQVVQHAIGALQHACSQAVDALKTIMSNPEAPASARVSAAKTVLELALKAVELENIEERLTALEAQLGGESP